MENGGIMNPENNAGNVTTTNVSHNPASKDNMVKVANYPAFNFALAIAWMVALLSILATLYFWWLQKNVADELAEKEAKKNTIISQISSPSLLEVEKKANNFKSSVSVLSTAKKSRFLYTTFLPDLYTKITNDTKISSMMLTSDGGSLSLMGTTKNYRSTADLVMALKSWDKLKNVDLVSVSMTTPDEQTGGAPEASFSISATVVNESAVKASTSSPTGGAQ